MTLRKLLSLTWEVNNHNIYIYIHDEKTKEIIFSNYDKDVLYSHWKPFSYCPYYDCEVTWIYECSSSVISVCVDIN